MRIRRLIILLLICVGMISGCFGFAFGVYKENDSYIEKVAAKEKLILKNYKGKVTIEPTQGDEIVFFIEKEVRGDIKKKIKEILEEVKVIIEQDEETVIVKIDRPDSLPWGVSETVFNFKIQVPESIVRNIDIDTRFAPVVAKDLSGELKIRTKNYPVVITNFLGKLIVKTTGRSIKLENVSGDVNLETTLAPITLKECAGKIRVKTTNNPIHLSSNEILENVYLETKNSSIYYESFINSGSTYRMKTTNGKIQFSIPENSKIDLDAHTSNGRIECELPFDEIYIQDKENLSGIMNGGGAEVDLIGINSNVYVLKLEN